MLTSTVGHQVGALVPGGQEKEITKIRPGQWREERGVSNNSGHDYNEHVQGVFPFPGHCSKHFALFIH